MNFSMRAVVGFAVRNQKSRSEMCRLDINLFASKMCAYRQHYVVIATNTGGELFTIASKGRLVFQGLSATAVGTTAANQQ